MNIVCRCKLAYIQYLHIFLSSSKKIPTLCMMNFMVELQFEHEPSNQYKVMTKYKFLAIMKKCEIMTTKVDED